MARLRKQAQDEVYSFAILVIGIIVIGFILLVMIRIQRGLLGFILAGAAILFLVYWLREIRRTIQREMMPPIASKQKTWVYDIIDRQDGITVVAEVPGPEDKVKVELFERTLKIQGGQAFTRELNLPKDAEIVESHYVNGVLNIRLRKI